MPNEKELQTEINDVIEGNLPPAAEPPVVEPPAVPPVEPPAGEPPVVEPPAVPAIEPPATPPVEPPVVPPVEPSVVPPVAETPEQTVARLTTELEETRKLVSQTAAQLTAPPTPPVLTPEQQEAERQRQAAAGPVVIPFVKDEAAMDEVFKTAGAFNQFMSGVVGFTVQTVYKSIPQMISRVADQQVAVRLAAKEFYDNNKDLIPYKDYIGVVTNELVAKNPEWTMDKVIEEVGTEVRKRLKLIKQAGGGQVLPNLPSSPNPPPGGEPPTGPGPGLPGAGGGGRRASGEAAVSALQKEINELL
jgi:hypothetical protein